MNINNLIREASAAAPDPERSVKNLERLSLNSPEFIQSHEDQIQTVALLFAYSQFLADYCISRPEALGAALRDIEKRIVKEEIIKTCYRGCNEMLSASPLSRQNALAFLRKLKKTYLLRITLRDIASVTDLQQCVSELSALAEAVLEFSLRLASALIREKFGDMKNNAFSVIGLGKLGAGELNYSSDIDIMTLYRSDAGLSSGVRTASGIRANPVAPHEYFCRLTETLSGLLHTSTEDGMAYRVDFRLRPNGQKGALSIPLNSCLSYYESWGKTWERVALIRARPVAGDPGLGEMFMRGVEPFIWKKSLDYSDVEEIKALKKRIDTVFDADDIKRGYGGIREIEFFVHAFQLLYGGERANLRSGRLLDVVREMSKEGFLNGEDAEILSCSYSFLRRIEHVLQMKDDLQLYTLPSDSGSLRVLSSKLRFNDEKKFASEVRLTRLKVRDMYNSLFGGEESTQDFLISPGEDLPEESLIEYLAFKGFKAPSAAVKNVHALREQVTTGKTIRERGLLRKVVPSFLEEVFKSPNKDRALTQLTSFIDKVGSHESFTDLLQKRDDTREALIRTFAGSVYLTRLLFSLENLEGIFEFPDRRRDLRSRREQLFSSLRAGDPLKVVREFKASQELKTGMLFLNRTRDAYQLMGDLSSLADLILHSVISLLGEQRGFAVIGLGAYGAEELNFGSDLDLLFVHSTDEVPPSASGGHEEHLPAKELIRILTEYTDSGVAYKVDMRLRPDGSKGILANDLQGYDSYYLKSAQPWEIQSLLRARPIAGDRRLLSAFDEIRRRVIQRRRQEITGNSLRAMRQRIVRELSREHKGYDIKLGPGGIKEIEFVVQYLQLKYADILPDLVLQNTSAALKGIVRHKLIDSSTAEILTVSHRFLCSVEVLLRLNGEEVLKTNSEIPDIIIELLNLKSKDELFGKIEGIRQHLSQITGIIYH